MFKKLTGVFIACFFASAIGANGNLVMDNHESINQQLRSAAIKGNLREVRRCIAAHADINTTTVAGFTTAERALFKGKLPNGWTPLHHAAAFGHPEVIAELRDAGANVSAQNAEGETPAHMVCFLGGDSAIFCLRELSFYAEANIINVPDFDGLVPLHLAACEGNYKAAEYFINSGVPVNIKDKEGMTPLHWAAICNQYYLVELLLERGADKSIKTVMHKTPFDMAKKLEIRTLLELEEVDEMDVVGFAVWGGLADD
ncbi:ankyrin repeat domain-containing protein [Candidatus Babeliales bacterium]|nr:ankyrin repeat domain-containing protein [Candidatus Babeliales bacterium]